MRFNQTSKQAQRKEMLSGGQGFKMTPEMELYTIVCASLLTPTYYVPDTNDQINRIKSLIRKVDPVFVAQLAVYAREQMYLRTIPMVLTVELAKCHRGDNLLRRLSGRVIQRADEITELLSYYVKANNLQPKFIKAKGGHSIEKKIYKLSNQLRKGIADSFFKFDEYQFAKYNRANEIKLRDALFLTHPKPRTQAQKELFEKIAQDTLETPYTWETQMSKAGQDGKDKKIVWQELIDSGRMNYMAMMRNLRNFLETGVSKSHIEKVAERLANADQVRKSKQLPFRFLTAYRGIGGAPEMRSYWGAQTNMGSRVNSPHTGILLDALEKAVKVSIENIPSLKGTKALIASDTSGSMQRPISEKSSIQTFDIGILLGLLVKSTSSDSVFGVFGDRWKPLTNTPIEDILGATNRAHKKEGEVGYGTHGFRVLEWALSKKRHFDKIMFFTDGQMYGRHSQDLRNIDEKWVRYKTLVNPEAKLYLFNLQGYGETPFDLRRNDTYLISGWSDKVFTMMDSIEKGEEALTLVKEIRV
jgi:60 kDa SS-A/Ro ribonucleoprotein